MNASPPAVDDPYSRDLFAVRHEAINHPNPASAAHAMATSDRAIEEDIVWSARLPRLARAELDASNALNALYPALRSPEVSRVLMEALAQLTSLGTTQKIWRCEIIQIRETSAALLSLTDETRDEVVAVFGVEPAVAEDEEEESLAACLCEAAFARRLIELVLHVAAAASEEHTEDFGDIQRTADEGMLIGPFSVVESAVLEFIFLQLARRLNGLVDAPLVALKTLAVPTSSFMIKATDDAATRAKKTRGAETEADHERRGLMVSVRVDCEDERSAVVRLYLPFRALEALNPRLNSLLRQSRSETDAGYLWRQQLLTCYQQITAEIPAALIIGQTEVVYADLYALEPGDVVFFDQTTLARRAKGREWYAERAQLRVGRGDNAHIIGRLSATGAASDTLAKSGTVASESYGERDTQKIGYDARMPTLTGSSPAHDELGETCRLMMSAQIVTEPRTTSAEERAAQQATQTEDVEGETESETPDAAAEEATGHDEFGNAITATAVQDLPLTIRAELPARRFTLDELIEARAGVTFDLGCRLTDPIELVMTAWPDDFKIARGRLIEIEGRLGLLLAQVSRPI